MGTLAPSAAEARDGARSPLSIWFAPIARLSLLAMGLMAALTPGEAFAQNGRPTRPPGWIYRPAQGSGPPSLSYDPCPGCDNHSTEVITLSCSRGTSVSIGLQPDDRRGVLPRLVGRQAEATLEVDSARYSLRGLVEQGPIGEWMSVQIDRASPLFSAIAAARTMRLVSPANAGSVTMSTRGSGEAMRRWAQACGIALFEGSPAPGSGMPPSAAAAPSSGGSTGNLGRFVGAPDYDGVLRHPTVAAALERMLSRRERQTLHRNLDVHSPVELVEGRLILQGNAPRAGDVLRAMVTVDVATGAVEVGLFEDPSVTVISEMPRSQLSPVMARWASTQVPNRPGFQFRQAGGQPAAAGSESPAQQTPSSLPRIAGSWEGSFACLNTNRQTQLLLNIVEDGPALRAIFNFQYGPGSRPDGAYEMSGSFDPRSRAFRLNPGAWIENPGRARAFSMQGDHDPVLDRLVGIMPQCSGFVLTRVQVQVR